MKVGIITIYDLMNFGNRLQSYAMIFLLKKYKIQSDSIVLKYSAVLDEIKDFIKKIIHKPIYENWSLKQESAEYVEKLTEQEKKRYIKFKDFSYEYLNIKHKKILKPFKPRWIEDYDCFTVGSDQVWNPRIDQAKEWEFLNFAPQGKRVSWAASFGTKSIDDPSGIIANGLRGLDHISVREEYGESIVYQLAGRESITLIDPTLMLDASEWTNISKMPDNFNFNDKYILMFFLGESTLNFKKIAKSLSQEYGYQIIDLQDEMCFAYESGPSEFIYLISHAQLILTDSFHACVFSFIFNKPFVVYDRNGTQCSMNSRIETLLKKFDLERKYANSNLENDIWEHNYEKGYEQLELERTKVLDFLRKALNVDM